MLSIQGFHFFVSQLDSRHGTASLWRRSVVPPPQLTYLPNLTNITILIAKVQNLQ